MLYEVITGFENAGLEIFNLMGYRLSTITHLGRNHKVPNMAYGVITSYSIHYTKLYDFEIMFVCNN